MDRLPRMYETVRSTDGFQGSAEGYDGGEVRVYDADGRLRFFRPEDLQPVVAPTSVGAFADMIVVGLDFDDEQDQREFDAEIDGYPENLGPEA